MGKKQRRLVECLSGVSFISLLPYLLLRERRVIQPPACFLLLGILLLLSAAVAIYNAKLSAKERLSWFSVGHMSYWHPMCNVALVAALFLVELPGMGETIGIIIIAAVFIGSFVVWLRKSD